MKKLSILMISVVLQIIVSCAEQKPANNGETVSAFFNKGDRVAFIGNSITHMGMFHNNIYLYHVTRFPLSSVKMYNLGISGDVTWGVLNRMEDDILAKKPDVAVIMLGMNDVHRNLYGPAPISNDDTLKMRKIEIDYYKTNLDSIVRIILSKGIRVILERPSIYDQTAVLPETNHLGVNDVLGECAVYIDELSVKYNLPVVDYYTAMNRINIEIQKNDASATLTGKDRIHPGETGHFIMAYQFLKAENAPKYVSKIIVDAGNLVSSDESDNCEISDVRNTENGIEFTVLENALPFPLCDDQKEAAKLVPFMNDFNVELLKTENLLKGTYALRIDDTLVDTLTNEELNDGINLAEYSCTPQSQQAQVLRKKFEVLWEMEGKLRGVKFIEYMEDYKACPDKDDLKFVAHFLDSIFSTYPNQYYKNQLKRYLQNKPEEEKLLKQSDEITNEIYQIAQPESHVFLLEFIIEK